MPAYLTGGNFLVDGHGTAFMTRAMVDENNSRMSDEAFLQMVEEFTGVHTCHVLDNTESPGIQHIDCWLKVLDEERLLVKQAPPDHPEYDWIEGNVRKLRQLETCFGRPYEILRIDCPVFGMERGFNPEEEPALPAYTNSLILNHRVFVPRFGGPGDEAALATYRRCTESSTRAGAASTPSTAELVPSSTATCFGSSIPGSGVSSPRASRFRSPFRSRQ